MNKLLLIEDNWKHLEELMLILQMENLHVFPATSPYQAMEEINIVQPDIVLIEIHYPIGATLDLIHWFRDHEKYQDKPIIVYTADSTVNVDLFKDANIQYFFREPFEVDSLIFAIKNSLNKG